MDWKDLAPWLALAITLALSILVPLFTQIANNKFQLKMYKEQNNKKNITYEKFLTHVGEFIGSGYIDKMEKAIASIHNLYVYAPEEWWTDLDKLCDYLRNSKYDEAIIVFRKLTKNISKELNK